MKQKEKKNEMAAEEIVNPQMEMDSDGEPQLNEATGTSLEEIQAELAEVQKKANENLECWQRERADFTNYKKRIEREQEALSQNVTANTIKKFLVVLDDLERALKLRPDSGDGGAWADGIELVYRKTVNLVESCGVTRMPVDDSTFDPNRHEAITHEDSSTHQSGQIIEVVQQGYMIGDRVLRPALVRVAR